MARSVIAIGIDLSGRTTGVTAAAVLVGDASGAPRYKAHRDSSFTRDKGDARLQEFVRSERPDCVAIDAPLSLPHTVVCADDSCSHCFPAGDVAPSYGRRSLETKAAWAGQGHTTKEPMPTAMLAAVAFRGIYLARLLRRDGFQCVVETWPMGVYRSIERASAAGANAPGGGDDMWRRGLLESVIRALPTDVMNRDVLDAVAAAYAAWSVATSSAVPVVGDGLEGEGEIWIPRNDVG